MGCLLVDIVCRKAGEEGLNRNLPPKRLAYVKKKVHQNAGWALVVASIAPPPFPFTPVVMAAAALEYPRRRLLTVVGAARMFRFTVAGALAMLLGRQILRWAKNDVVQALLFGLVVVCMIGSAVSAYRWIQKSRTATVSSGHA